jgi:hypothetical protein
MTKKKTSPSKSGGDGDGDVDGVAAAVAAVAAMGIRDLKACLHDCPAIHRDVNSRFLSSTPPYDQGLTFAHFRAQLEHLWEHAAHVRAQLEHIRDTFTG